MVKEGPSKPQTQAQLSKELSLLSEVFKRVFERLETKDKAKNQKGLEELLGKEIRISDFVLEEDRLFLPFLFKEENSWGYLEIIVPKEKGDKVRLFWLKVFLNTLEWLRLYFLIQRILLKWISFLRRKRLGNLQEIIF